MRNALASVFLLLSGFPAAADAAPGRLATDGIHMNEARRTCSERLSFTGYSNKNPLLYSCGEEMRFYVTLVDTARNDAPVKGRRLVWTRTGDDGVTEKGEAASDEPLLVKTSIAKPGFVRVTVKVLDAAGKPVRDVERKREVMWDGGAGADVNRIPAVPLPADFDAFWDARRAALAKAPCAARLTELPSRNGKVALAKFLVPMPDAETPAQGLVAWPKAARPHTLPLDVEVTGYGFHRTHLDESRALLGSGRILVSITRQGEDPRREEAYYKNIETNVCRHFCFRNNNGRPEETDFYKMLMRNVQALRWAKTLPTWDGRSIRVHGGSMGGYQALGLAALDPQVSEVGAYIPWCADFAGYAKFKRLGGWAPGWTKALDYVALAHLATRVRCPVEMQIGLGDYVCPPSGEVLLFNNLKGPKKLTATQNMGHGSALGPNPPVYRFENRLAVLPDLPRRLSVTLDGRPVRVEEARCSKFPLNQVWPGFQRPMEQTEIDCFVNVDLPRPGTLAVTVPGLAGGEVLMRPMSEGARCTAAGDTVTVKLEKPGQFTLEFGPRGTAKRFPALHVFVNPPFAYTHVPGELYFGPGEHDVGLVSPTNGQTVCLAPGAVVYGALYLHGVRDVRVVGRGIFDGSRIERCDPGSAVYRAAVARGLAQDTTADTVCNSFTACASTNVYVEGVTFRDSGSWTVKIRGGSRDVTLDNVKIVGMWRYNTDGINICASERVTVRNSFVRSYDDCFVARGSQISGDDGRPTRDILVENCNVWCDWGKCFEVWAGRDPCVIERVRFRGNRILSMAALACDVTTWYGSKSSVIRDIAFEDLEIDLPPPRYGQVILNRSFSSDFKATPCASDAIVTIDCDRLGDMVAEQQAGGVSDYTKYALSYRDIALRNVKLFGQPSGRKNLAKVITKFPCHTIENVVFENVPEMEIVSGGAVKGFTVNGKARVQ